MKISLKIYLVISLKISLKIYQMVCPKRTAH